MSVSAEGRWLELYSIDGKRTEFRPCCLLSCRRAGKSGRIGEPAVPCVAGQGGLQFAPNPLSINPIKPAVFL